MILVWGPGTDAPIEKVFEALEARGADIFHIDEGDLKSLRYDIVLEQIAVVGSNRAGDELQLTMCAAFIFDRVNHFRPPRARCRWYCLPLVSQLLRLDTVTRDWPVVTASPHLWLHS